MTKTTAELGHLDWAGIAIQLDQEGHAMLPGLLRPADVDALTRLPGTPAAGPAVPLASRDLGSGDVFCLTHPLHEQLLGWCTALHAHLAPIANRWNETLGSLGVGHRHPERLVTGPSGRTPAQATLSRLREHDHQTLHHSADGEHVFPLQLVALLSEPGVEFTGGEFVMVEQRPRMQSRPMVLPLKRGDVAIIATAQRPFDGGRGPYRVTLKHAISRVRGGERIGFEWLYPGGLA